KHYDCWAILWFDRLDNGLKSYGVIAPANGRKVLLLGPFRYMLRCHNNPLPAGPRLQTVVPRVKIRHCRGGAFITRPSTSFSGIVPKLRLSSDIALLSPRTTIYQEGNR